jgi:DMSO/TMAO reductase YedYZ heme-binding membrane subunit
VTATADTATSLDTGRTNPLGAGRSWRSRLLLHHLPLAAVSLLLVCAFIAVPPFTKAGRADFGPFDLGVRTLTIATGYVALLLLAATLLVGTVNMLLRRRNPVSTYLCRDLGTWSVLLSAVHVFFSFGAHGGGGISSALNFFVIRGTPFSDKFGLGNWVGLIALIIALSLLAISTDASLRELGAARWKSWQRLNYTLFGLTVVHSLFYGALGRLSSPFTILLFATTVLVLAGQLLGVALWRRRRHRPGAGAAGRTSRTAEPVA